MPKKTAILAFFNRLVEYGPELAFLLPKIFTFSTRKPLRDGYNLWLTACLMLQRLTRIDKLILIFTKSYKTNYRRPRRLVWLKMYPPVT